MIAGRHSAVRVLLADDHEMVRMSLRLFFETCEGIVVVGEAEDGHEAVQLCGTLRPHLVLLDLVMPRMNGVLATQAIRKHYPTIKILLLTTSVDFDLINDALKAGADGYVLKSGSKEIMKAINDLFPP